MTRRRESRRRQRVERRDRDPAVTTERAHADAKEEPHSLQDVSLTGVAGGVVGFIQMVALGIGIIFDPGADAWVAGIFFALSLIFVPVIWASWVRTEKRNSIQRVTVFACLGVAAGGSILLPLGFAIILAIPTTLLAIAAGLVFQGSRES